MPNKTLIDESDCLHARYEPAPKKSVTKLSRFIEQEISYLESQYYPDADGEKWASNRIQHLKQLAEFENYWNEFEKPKPEKKARMSITDLLKNAIKNLNEDLKKGSLSQKEKIYFQSVKNRALDLLNTIEQTS